MTDDTPPEWLRQVVVRVNELVADAQVMDRFCEMLRRWYVEERKRGPKTRRDKRGRLRPHPVEWLPNRRLTLPEKYATLCAIHNELAHERAKRIDPWAGSKHNFNRLLHGMRFAVFSGEVKPDARLLAASSTYAQRDRIERILADVERDLAEMERTPPRLTLQERLVAASRSLSNRGGMVGVHFPSSMGAYFVRLLMPRLPTKCS